ncbi:MAG TPA: hypothetical protein VE890_08520 [Thermoguttaceae bacterium]|nr:hypothetical protein [Thermoguttaceae bacterium]
MSWTLNAIKKHITGEQCETFEECVSRLRHRDADAHTSENTAARVEQLEGDLARAVLLIHALTEACLERGVFTREEIAQAAAEIDLLDGVADGKLDPATVRPKEKRKPPVVQDR